MNTKYMNRQRGMSLIEIVVSMLIIGLGLGMSISMIQASNRYAESAENRAVALAEVQSIVSSMRANKLGGPAYVNQNAQFTPTCAPNCTNTELLVNRATNIAYAKAAAEMATWKNNLPIVLPGGRGVIANNGNLYTVTVTWNAMDENDLGVAQNKNAESVTLSLVL